MEDDMVRILVVAISVAFSVALACGYNANLDCAVTCNTTSDCPSSLTCDGRLCTSAGVVCHTSDASADGKLIDAPVGGGIAFDNKSSGSAGSGSSTIMWQHQVGSGANRVLVVGVSISHKDSGVTVTGIQYGGQSFYPTPAVAFTGTGSGSDGRAELWRLTNPATGTSNVVVTLSGALTSSDGAAGGSVSLFGVNQTAPIGSVAMASATTVSSPSVTLTTTMPGAWVIDDVSFNAVTGLIVGSAGSQLHWWNQLAAGITSAGSTQTAAAAGSATVNWTASSPDTWTQVIAELKPQ